MGAETMKGKVFGSYLVLEDNGYAKDRDKILIVRCMSCGNERKMRGSTVRRHAKEVTNGRCKECFNARKTHGFSSDKRFKVWNSMVARCKGLGPKSKRNYLDRGITVCEEWKDEPSQFMKWLKDNHWREDLEIDRIDNDGNYSPENCRIVTRSGNCNNTRRNRRIVVHGENLTIAEAGRKYDINENTIWCRLMRLGWDGDSLVKGVS